MGSAKQFVAKISLSIVGKDIAKSFEVTPDVSQGKNRKVTPIVTKIGTHVQPPLATVV
ncbi:hypothetical protein ES707_12541 [subsurface metagenome]